MWRTLFAATLVYGYGHPSLDGYRPALLDRPLQSFHQDVNSTARDGKKVLATIDDALGRLPGDRNMRFVRAGALAGSGDVDAAMTELRALVAEHAPFEVIIRSFAAKGLMAMPDGVSIDAVLGLE